MAFEPVIIEAREPVEVEQIHVFTIGGVDYHMPAEVPPSISLEAVEVLRQEGQAVASAWVLEEVLGHDGYEALITCRDMTKAELDYIVNGIMDHVSGELSGDAEGNGQGLNRAQRRSGTRAASSNGRSGGPGSPTTKRTSTRTSGASTTSTRSKRKTT